MNTTERTLKLEIDFGQTARKCGDCQLCCKLLPVLSIGKKASERCKHQRAGKGCTVYHKPGFPLECGLWNCGWLLGLAGDTRRPDRTHYVVDVMPDTVEATHDDTGEKFTETVVQIWVDPDYPDAHRDPALRAWLEENRATALVRYNASDALFLVPPSRSQSKTWIEKPSQGLTDRSKWTWTSRWSEAVHTEER